MLCAMIREGVVIEVRDVPEEELTPAFVNSWSQVVDITNEYPFPEPGWLYSNNVFSTPPNYTGAASPKRITKLALRNRLTLNEKIAIEALALNTANPYCIPLRAWIQDFQVATFVDLSRPDTITGVQFLEQLGLLAAGRANTILNAPITDIEKYREKL